MQIRVLTLNVWNKEGAAGRMRLITEEVKRLQPDLISFQEVIRSPEEDQLQELVGGLGKRPFRCARHVGRDAKLNGDAWRRRIANGNGELLRLVGY